MGHAECVVLRHPNRGPYSRLHQIQLVTLASYFNLNLSLSFLICKLEVVVNENYIKLLTLVCQSFL